MLLLIESKVQLQGSSDDAARIYGVLARAKFLAQMIAIPEAGDLIHELFPQSFQIPIICAAGNGLLGLLVFVQDQLLHVLVVHQEEFRHEMDVLERGLYEGHHH